MSRVSGVVRRFFARRAVAGVLAVLASAGTLSAVEASSASAAVQWEAPITFECYRSGMIQADPIGTSLASGQGNVVWGLFLEIWNASTRQWVHYYTSPLQHYDSNQMFQELVPQPIDVNVARNRYYLAYDVIGTSSTPPRFYRDHAEIGATSEFVCHVP